MGRVSRGRQVALAVANNLTIETGEPVPALHTTALPKLDYTSAPGPLRILGAGQANGTAAAVKIDGRSMLLAGGDVEIETTKVGKRDASVELRDLTLVFLASENASFGFDVTKVNHTACRTGQVLVLPEERIRGKLASCR